jgi:hypothetical protein
VEWILRGGGERVCEWKQGGGERVKAGRPARVGRPVCIITVNFYFTPCIGVYSYLQRHRACLVNYLSKLSGPSIIPQS